MTTKPRGRIVAGGSSFRPEIDGVVDAPFSERFYVPKREEPGFRLFGLLTVKHDRALALVYGAAVGGWLYLLVDASLSLGRHGAFAVALVIAAAGAAGVVGEVHRHDSSPQMRTWERPPGTDVASADEGTDAST